MTHHLASAGISIFQQKPSIFVTLKNTVIDYMLIQILSFAELVLASKGSFNERGYNFDNASKICYSMPS